MPSGHPFTDVQSDYYWTSTTLVDNTSYARIVYLRYGGVLTEVKTYGWINFKPTHGGVTVYADHLEGHAWGENIGWIRLGTHTGGGAHTYTNDAASTYGVNNDGSGSLSGYAWGTNVGWISFNPAHGGVTIDPQTGVFDGYAWGENVGWISFKGTGYGVVTSFRNYKTHLPLVVRQ